MNNFCTFLLFSIIIFEANPLHSQENPPVSSDDYIHIIIDIFNPQQFELNVLLNDYDPDGDAIKIAEVYKVGSNDTIQFSDSTIIYQSESPPKGLCEQDFIYRVCKVNNPSILSNPAKLTVNPAMSETAPVARNDTLYAIPLQDLFVDVLQNDYYPFSDTILIGSNSGEVVGDSLIFFDFWSDDETEKFYWDYYKGYLKGYYIIYDTLPYYESFDQGYFEINFNPVKFYDSLDINNINALFNCFGNHFWDMPGGLGARFKVPNGTWHTSFFSNTLWVGGLDEDSNLHLASEKYRMFGVDFWHGPISNVYDTDYDLKWFKIWKLTKAEIDYHKFHWWENGYEPIFDIETWPGNGDPEMGQMEKIAPFYDADGDGLYEPLNGDYPVIKGDQALFFVFNDARKIHTESHGIPLGVEIHAMAYAFDAPEDSTLWSTVFLHYDIINRTDTIYYDSYLGSFNEPDLGYLWDDRIQCDVQNGMFFTYNGQEIDPVGPWDPDQPQIGYGAHPPAQGVVFLGGPYMDADGLDNPRFDNNGNQLCNESINGLNFGDTIVDNERLGMNTFLLVGYAWPLDYPNQDSDYYNYMKAILTDGSNLQYGGYGYPPISVGPECSFMFPKDSDTCNWGTNGIPPNGGFNQNGFYWDEESTGGNPSDRRGVASLGPFTFEPGDVEQLDIAFVWARDYNGTAWSSAELLKERVKLLRQKFEDDPEFFSNASVRKSINTQLLSYPNPVKDNLFLDLPNLIKEGKYIVFDAHGRIERSGIIDNQLKISIPGKNFAAGLYIILIFDNNKVYSSKFVKE